MLWKLTILLFIFVLPMPSFGQEICSNGIDDDGDGLTDWKDTLDCPCGWDVGTMSGQNTIYYIPNAFTPDGDERNNEFLPIFTCGFDVLNYELRIYDNRGAPVFKSNSHHIGWDGTSNGVLLKSGTYPWTVSYKSSYTDETRFLEGHVNLIR